ncbi:MAG: ABC transporter permease, partial [Dehalococcoidia bacterium]|nr:ABC transporter permease [Dehalococcoidia bacterium]
MKDWLEPFSSALSAISQRKLRSFLTILGVVIGVSAVIALMSIGRGTQTTILTRIESLGANLLFVRPGSVSQFGVAGGAGSATTLTHEDGLAIAEQVPGIATVIPLLNSSVQVISGGRNTRTQVVGSTPEYQQTYNLVMADGVFFSQWNYDNSMRVAVIGPNVKETLFGSGSAVGREIRMANTVALVIGVFQSKGQSTLGLNDDSIIMPMTALRAISGQRTSGGQYIVNSLVIALNNKEDSAEVVSKVAAVLRERHRLAPTADNDFTITSVAELAETMSEAMGSMTLLLGAIAAISLLVGGIGVMNIMLVSVVERTREIGIRKALGAQDWNIWVQFLVEAAVLTLSGGLVGIGVGWGIATMVSRFGNMATTVSPDIVVLAVSVSAAVGLFFGFYP